MDLPIELDQFVCLKLLLLYPHEFVKHHPLMMVPWKLPLELIQ
jgi:hypothetical protein